MTVIHIYMTVIHIYMTVIHTYTGLFTFQVWCRYFTKMWWG